MFGDVWLELEPNPDGGVEFAEQVVGGSVPKGFFAGVEKGIREAAEGGVLAGYPLSDFRATLYDGSFHPVDSNELSFKIAASMALKDGVHNAKPALLEPIMAVEIRVPEAYMGEVNRDLNGRRGRVLGMDTRRRHAGHQRPRAAGRAVHLRHRAALAGPGPRHVHGDARPLRRRPGPHRREGDRGPPQGARGGRRARRPLIEWQAVDSAARPRARRDRKVAGRILETQEREVSRGRAVIERPGASETRSARPHGERPRRPHRAAARSTDPSPPIRMAPAPTVGARGKGRLPVDRTRTWRRPLMDTKRPPEPSGEETDIEPAQPGQPERRRRRELDRRSVPPRTPARRIRARVRARDRTRTCRAAMRQARAAVTARAAALARSGSGDGQTEAGDDPQTDWLREAPG